MGCKIYATEVFDGKPKGNLGTFLSDGKTFIEVNANDGRLKITELQLQGKKRMKIEEFLKLSLARVRMFIKYQSKKSPFSIHVFCLGSKLTNQNN